MLEADELSVADGLLRTTAAVTAALARRISTSLGGVGRGFILILLYRFASDTTRPAHCPMETLDRHASAARRRPGSASCPRACLRNERDEVIVVATLDRPRKV